MPKETVYNAHYTGQEERPPQIEVGWMRGLGHVQVATAMPFDRSPDIRTISDVMRDDLAFVDKHRDESRWTGESNYAEELEQMIAVHERGWYVELDRDGINRLIRVLRKARDAAFGADA